MSGDLARMGSLVGPVCMFDENKAKQSIDLSIESALIDFARLTVQVFVEFPQDDLVLWGRRQSLIFQAHVM